ncbi:MAG: preprotein translocase subunit SecE [Phycisphaeraceae bacterium]|nr:preprotein translocase subunit SecE [Phycisphaeraceae bacterium]
MSIFTIPKPGQGKIARLGSAVGFGVVLLGTVFWLVSEIGSVFSYLREVRTDYGQLDRPYNRFTQDRDQARVLRVTHQTAVNIQNRHRQQLEAEEPVALRMQRVDGGRPTSFMISGVITDGPGQSASLTLVEALPRDFDAGRRIESADARNMLIWVSGGTAVVLILGGLGMLFFILNRPRIVDFLIATEDEMRKVNWPSKKEVIGATWVVILGTLFMGVTLWIVDLIFAELFINIGILEGQSTLHGVLQSIFGGR